MSSPRKFLKNLSGAVIMFDKLIEIEGEPFIIDLMYARTDNMTGRAVYNEIGLGNHAFVHKSVWDCLQKLVPMLNEKGLKLKVCDAYRPPIAHEKLLSIIPHKGFFAQSPEASQHCHATAVDVVLTDENGQELNFITNVDGYRDDYALEVQQGNVENFFRYLQKARHDYQPQTPEETEACVNREMLRQMMETIGFEALIHEWWHYNLPDGKSSAYPMIEWNNLAN